MNSYRIDPDLAIGPVSLTVSDLARSLAFYRDVLGLQAQATQGGATAFSVEDGTPLVLLTEDRTATRRSPRAPGLYHMAILLPGRSDLARVILRFSETRYPVQGASDHGVSEALYLADPEGNGIEIYRDRPRSEWPLANGQLKMVTEALDIEGVIGTLGDRQQGAGLPSGTHMGHIHLQVSNIPAAESFYRDVLGFDLMQRYGPSAAFLSAGGYHHHVGMNTWMSAGSPPASEGSTGLRYFTVILPSREALQRLAAHLAGQAVEYTEVAEGLLVRDPSANAVLLTS